MTRQDSRAAQNYPHGTSDFEAAVTSTAIAGLRRRLKHNGIEHPSVRRELGKLEDLLIALFEQAGRPGRHRSQASKSNGRQAGHASGDTEISDLKPDPAGAITPADFLAVLWRCRAWSGDPSWCHIAARSRQRASHSAIYKAMHRQELPKLEVLEAILIGCGGKDDLPAFVAARQRINSASSRCDSPACIRRLRVPSTKPRTARQPGVPETLSSGRRRIC
jgi:hypothetical protein